MAEADHGYDNFKGVMLCERPTDSGAKYSAGSKGAGSLSEPFKSAVAETNELGLPPTGESRSKISSLVARNRRIRRYTQNNALTKHRRWLSRFERTAQVAKEADELDQLEAEERKRKFKNFTTALRKKILEGSSLDNMGWASLTRGKAHLSAASTREPTPALGDDGEAGEAGEAPAQAQQPKLTKTLKKKERKEVDLEMSQFLDEALQDALEREKAYAEEEEAENSKDQDAKRREASEAGVAGSAPKPGAKGPTKKSSRPAWALSETQAQAREDDEEEELMSFVDNLDYDSYMDDFDQAEENAIDAVVKKVGDEESLEDEKKWKKSFVTAVNEAINDEIMEKNLNGSGSDEEDEEGDGEEADETRSMRSGVTRASRMSRMSRMSRLSKKEGSEGEWDSSTVVGSNDRDEKENAGRKMSLASEILEDHSYLKQNHTAQSIKHILESVKEEVTA